MPGGQCIDAVLERCSWRGRSRTRDLPSDGLIGVTLSGKMTGAEFCRKGAHEVSCGITVAMNQYLRSRAVRHIHDAAALAPMAPGWIRIELGGPKAPLGADEMISKPVVTLTARQDRPGLPVVDRYDATAPG